MFNHLSSVWVQVHDAGAFEPFAQALVKGCRMHRGFEAGLRNFVQESSGVRFGVGVSLGVIGFWAKVYQASRLRTDKTCSMGKASTTFLMWKTEFLKAMAPVFFCSHARSFKLSSSPSTCAHISAAYSTTSYSNPELIGLNLTLILLK